MERRFPLVLSQEHAVVNPASLSHSRLQPSIDDLLRSSNENLLEYFIGFLCSHCAERLARLWFICDSFRARWDSNDEAGVRAHAAEIMARFLSPGDSCVSAELCRDTILLACPESGIPPQHTFTAVQMDVRQQLFHHYDDFLISPHYSSFLADQFFVRKPTVQDLAHCSALAFSFTEYLDTRGAVDLLMFWLKVVNFYDSFDPTTAQRDAITIYSGFISLAAPASINFPTSVRQQTEQLISSSPTSVEPNCFLRPLSIVHNTLTQVYAAEYLSSPVFEQLLHSLQPSRSASSDIEMMSWTSEGHERKKPQTVAEREAVKLQKEMQKQADKLNIDLAMLQPEAVYQRVPPEKAHSICFVDQYGRYTSSFGSRPPKPQNRSLTSLFVDKELEERMADQMAQLIISGVNKDASGDAAPSSNGGFGDGFGRGSPSSSSRNSSFTTPP